jgi:hypothetical protein
MRRGSTTERGYGWAHQQARAEALAVMPDGQACTRCRLPMWRAEAELLDLDHTDDRSQYAGLAHRSCNRRAGQAKAVASRQRHGQARRTSKRSRNW